jgi:hypothetical protein
MFFLPFSPVRTANFSDNIVYQINFCAGNDAQYFPDLNVVFHKCTFDEVPHQLNE